MAARITADDEHEGAAVIIQGKLIGGDRIAAAGLVAQPARRGTTPADPRTHRDRRQFAHGRRRARPFV
jgi:hypothetical protein